MAGNAGKNHLGSLVIDSSNHDVFLKEKEGRAGMSDEMMNKASGSLH